MSTRACLLVRPFGFDSTRQYVTGYLKKTEKRLTHTNTCTCGVGGSGKRARDRGSEKNGKRLTGHAPPSVIRETHAHSVVPRIDYARQNMRGDLKTTTKKTHDSRLGHGPSVRQDTHACNVAPRIDHAR